jgi:hypothetical protein
MLGTWKIQLSISEGPVCSFKGFQFGTRRAILALEPEDPDWEVVQPFEGIGGLHQLHIGIVIMSYHEIDMFLYKMLL